MSPRSKNLFTKILLPLASALLILLAFLLISTEHNSETPNTNEKKTETPNTNEPQKQELVAYTTGSVNVRKCANLNCEVVGIYPAGIPARILFGLDRSLEWTAIYWFDDQGNRVTGYIATKFLSEENPIYQIIGEQQRQISQLKLQLRQNIAPQQKTQLLTADIVKSWANSVGIVLCGTPDIGFRRGSGTLFKNIENQFIIITNSHVSAGFYTDECSVTIPHHDTSEKVDRMVNFPVATIGRFTADKEKLDEVVLYLKPDVENRISYSDGIRLETPTSLAGLESVAKKSDMCLPGIVSIGDEVVVLGYPSIGSKGSITVTRGIVSGIEKDYYVTDAKIERGNSGGAAILQKYNCYFGIPTLSNIGEIESIARILDMTRFAAPP